MPAAAPDTKGALRSAADRGNIWANGDLLAPPVMTVGPSAPNGPPVPMEMASELGFGTAASGCRR